MKHWQLWGGCRICCGGIWKDSPMMDIFIQQAQKIKNMVRVRQTLIDHNSQHKIATTYWNQLVPFIISLSPNFLWVGNLENSLPSGEVHRMYFIWRVWASFAKHSSLQFAEFALSLGPFILICIVTTPYCSQYSNSRNNLSMTLKAATANHIAKHSFSTVEYRSSLGNSFLL